MENVYHSGEKEMQAIAGEEKMAALNGRIVKSAIVKGAFQFIESQSMMIVCSADGEGRIWTSVLLGRPGFIQVTAENEVLLDRRKIFSPPTDVFYENIAAQPETGVLFIELSSRRRYRVNGNAYIDAQGIRLEILEAYPNCPQYIQRRVFSAPMIFKTNGDVTEGDRLGQSEKDWIRRADTFFVGSHGSNKRMDASHRGGFQGFVEILDDGVLKIPDYQGNSMFNTLGNWIQHPAAGLLFIDFGTGATLQLTGGVELLFDQTAPEDAVKTGGTGRYWLFRSMRWIKTENNFTDLWEFVDYSPFNPRRIE